VPVVVSADNAQTLIHVDQSTGAGGWQLIMPDQAFGALPGEFVQIGNGTGESNKIVIADALMLAYNAAQDSPTDGSLPGWWSTYYYGVQVPGSLPGANGYSAFASYVIGLTPTDPASTLSFNLSSQSSELQAVFSPCLSGRSYQLVASTNLNNAVWNVVPNTTVTVNAAGQGVINVPVPTDSQTFYRLSVQLSP
jgi:hypothetical protein